MRTLRDVTKRVRHRRVFRRRAVQQSGIGLVERITCPTLVCEAENDALGGDAKPLYDAIKAPKHYVLFTNADGSGEHDAAGAAVRLDQRVFDWLDETLAGID